MSEIKAVYPLLEGISIGQSISERSGAVCYAAMNTATGEKFILKHISIPESQVQVEALILTGSCADEAAAKVYYTSVAGDLKEELAALSKAAEGKGFVAYNGYQIAEKDNGVGFDAYLLGTYRRSLGAYAKKNAFTHLQAVNLAMDLCAALASCREAGFLYVDLKPENIFLTGEQYAIGDVGFLPLDALAYASFPDKYLSPYSAPEVRDLFSSVNTTVDTYALGMILYGIYNGGRLPFEDETDPEAALARRLKDEPIPAPVYADYEMAEIILKAIAFDPKERWKTPEEMGQALMGYMQRNEVNDSIIAPPIVSDLPLDPAELADSEDASAPDEADGNAPADNADADPFSQDPTEDEADGLADMSLEELLAGVNPDLASELGAGDGSSAADSRADRAAQQEISDMLKSADDTAPQEDDVDPDASTQDTELAHMLAQADGLIQHAEEVAQAERDARQKAEDEARAKEEAERAAKEQAERKQAEKEQAEREAKEKEKADAIAKEKREKTAGRRKFWKTFGIVVLVLALLAGGGFFYYRNFYCIYMQDMSISDSSQESLTVALNTEADQSLFILRCTDTYGNTQAQTLTDGKATFTGLTPDTQYTITAEVSGFHTLVGNVTLTYTTLPNIDIASFTAVAGQEDGSVILNMTVTGPEPEEWTVTYSAEDEETQATTFTGHMATVSGLTVGKTYTFRLNAGENMAVTGSTSAEFTAAKILTAQNLAITDYTGTSLTAAWDTPETEVSSWTVRCFNDNGYDQSQQVTSCSATFDGIDSASAYTVEVTAAGMTLGSHVYVSENPVVITGTSVTPAESDPTRATVSWDFTGAAPQSGWLLLYSYGADESATEVAHCETNSVELTNLIPNASYTFELKTADDLTVFGGSFTATTPAAGNFSGYGITGSDIYMAMFPRPDKDNWTFDDVYVSTYATSFQKDQKIAFVLEITTNFQTGDEDVSTLCVVRDSSGKPVDYYRGTEQWHAMWTDKMYLGDLERTPQTPGNYTLELYFNGALVKSQSFTVTE